MKHDDARYTCRTEFDENAVRLMFKTEYFTYEKKLLLMRCAFAAALLIAGMLTLLPIGARILCLLVGVWLIVAMDFPSKVRAEGVIQRMGGAKTHVNLAFGEKEIRVEQKQVIPYAAVDRLIEDDAYFYIFQNKQTAVMAAKGGLEPGEPDAFRTFVEEKTGKSWKRNVDLISMNLFDLLGTASAKNKKKKTGSGR